MRSWASAWRRPRRRPTRVGLPLYRYVGGVDANLLPVPMMNILNGGVHADNGIDFQEFMVMPVGAREFRRGAALRRGDFPCAQERRFTRRACRPRSATRAGSRRPSSLRAKRLDYIEKAVSAAGYKLGDDVLLALDCAASEFFKDGAYRMDGRGQDAVASRDGRLPRRACGRLSDRLDRGRHGRGRCRGLEGADGARSATGCSWSATMPS